MSTSHISVDCVVVCQLRCTINNQVSENYVEDQKKKKEMVINFCVIGSAHDRALRLAGRHRDKEIC